MVVEFLESDLSQMQKDAEKQNARNDHINSEKIPKFFLVGKEWEYRGEGNGSIVLSLPKVTRITIYRLKTVLWNQSEGRGMTLKLVRKQIYSLSDPSY